MSKACPWCKESEHLRIEIKVPKTSGKKLVRCLSCGASGPPAERESHAWMMWNSRTATASFDLKKQEVVKK